MEMETETAKRSGGQKGWKSWKNDKLKMKNGKRKIRVESAIASGVFDGASATAGRR